MALVVSACLLGEPCRYNGKAKPCEKVIQFCEDKAVVPVCPECAGGLPIPRPPAEQKDGRVVRQDGLDVTEAFELGAKRSLEQTLLVSDGLPELAILKANSPSCGVGYIYDGSFTKTLIEGDGIFTRMLKDAGVAVMSELEIQDSNS